MIPMLPFVRVTLTAKRPQNPDYPKELTTLGDHIRKRRLDLGLRQKDVSTTIRVSELTVNGWERHRYSPCLACLPRIISFLTYTPPPFDEIPDNVVDRIRLYRRTHGFNQEKLSELIGIDETTIAKWERGEHKPSKKIIEKISILGFL
jgi:DNA-binding XRE family transcriptional regulator